MMFYRRYFELFFACLLSLLSYASSLQCYQCNSSMDTSCQENFAHDLTGRSLKPTKCLVTDAEYCIKTTGVWGGIAGTFRFCSSRDMGIQCQYIRYQDHDRLYMACVHTCTTDGCNHASSISVHRLYVVIASLLAVVLWCHRRFS